MNPLMKASLAWQSMAWRIQRNKKAFDYRPKIDNYRFVHARRAALLVPDRACIMTSGMAGNAPCSILYQAIRKVFEETGHPRNLTVIAAGGVGGRGRVPGTVEELAVPGLLSRYISGHLGSVPLIVDLAAQGDCELHTLPQGIIAQLAECQSHGNNRMRSSTGVGTVMDPRTGRGSVVWNDNEANLVETSGNRLLYRLPWIDVALVLAPAADEVGNVYMKGASMIGEYVDAAAAASRNGGTVIVTVAQVVPKCQEEISIPAEKVGAIVVNRTNEQIVTVPQQKSWDMFLPGSRVNSRKALERLNYLNHLLHLEPRRGPTDDVIVRLATLRLVQCARPGNWVMIGFGLPQEVARTFDQQGMAGDVTFLLETGVFGGIPAPGVLFGSAVNPDCQLTTAEMFRNCKNRLDVAILRMLQVDSKGNVNTSGQGRGGPWKTAGPGGAMDIAEAARTILFVGRFMGHAGIRQRVNRMDLRWKGVPRFVERVDEVTFNGREALRRGKNIYYVTDLGTFQLTGKGLLLVEVMPGIDPKKDIVEGCPARIRLPEDGPVPIADPSVLTGHGFRPEWERFNEAA